MLVFVVALKSQQVSKSWERVSQLFERSIKSVCNQTSDNFHAIVVCHEKPDIEFEHPKLTYIQVDFPIPKTNVEKAMDRSRKVVTALIAARDFNPTHVMKVDADDCISRHLAKFVEEHPRNNGWYFNRGYLYEEGSNFVFLKRRDFYRWCGTCNIIRYDLQELPKETSNDSLDYNLYHRPHSRLAREMDNKGFPFQPLAFEGAVYVVCNGENTENFDNTIRPKKILPRMKKIILNYRPLSPSIINDFELYSID